MIKKVNFYFKFFEKKSIPHFYENVSNRTNGKISPNNFKEIGRGKNRVTIVNFIPPYLDLKISKEKSPYRAFQVKPRTGFIIDLSQYANADEYLKMHLGTKNRRNIISRLNRLESCFDISYKCYFGEIEKLEYDFLFVEFERMISSRFEQRGEDHVGFQRWDEYKESVYDMILAKRASLFVIYDKEKPIVINLNYHYDNIMDIAIPSYDIDYYKFGLGQTALFKQLDWCFQNNYKRVDMRWGELAYKRLWCNAIQEYRCDVVYNKKLPTHMILAYVVSKCFNIKKELVDRKLWPIGFGFLSNGSGKDDGNVEEAPLVKIEELGSLPSQGEIIPIDINKNEFQYIRNLVYNYQYIQKEHTKDIKVYNLNNEKTSYIIQGKSKLQKLIL